MLLEVQEPLLELGQGYEIIGSKHLSLDDREVNLDLVEPTGMNRHMHQDGIRPLRAVAAVRPSDRDEKNRYPRSKRLDGRPVGFLTHHFNQAASKGLMPLFFAQRPKTLARCTSQAAR